MSVSGKSVGVWKKCRCRENCRWKKNMLFFSDAANKSFSGASKSFSDASKSCSDAAKRLLLFGSACRFVGCPW
jgi:hypothetical protein